MEEHKVTRLQAALGQCALEQVLGGQALEHHGRTGLEADAVRQLAHALGRHHPHFAIAARWLAGIGRAVAHLEVAHALAHRLDHTGGFHAQLHREVHRIEAAALVDINVVEAHRMVADTHLAGAGLAHGDLHQLQLLGAAVLGDVDGAGCH